MSLTIQYPYVDYQSPVGGAYIWRLDDTCSLSSRQDYTTQRGGERGGRDS